MVEILFDPLTPRWRNIGRYEIYVMMDGQITIKRTTSYPDRLRAYKIKVDGMVVGSARAGETVTIPVSPGAHSIVLRIDWCGSDKVDFDIQADGSVFFECGSNLSGWRMILALFYVIFKTHCYLWLRRTTPNSPLEPTHFTSAIR